MKLACILVFAVSKGWEKKAPRTPPVIPEIKRRTDGDSVWEGMKKFGYTGVRCL